MQSIKLTENLEIKHIYRGYTKATWSMFILAYIALQNIAWAYALQNITWP